MIINGALLGEFMEKMDKVKHLCNAETIDYCEQKAVKSPLVLYCSILFGAGKIRFEADEYWAEEDSKNGFQPIICDFAIKDTVIISAVKYWLNSRQLPMPKY